MTRDEAYSYRRMIERGARSLDDVEAVRVPLLFPRWEEYSEFTAVDVASGTRVVGDDMRLYRVITAHTRQDDWKPSITPTLFELIEGQEHKGDVDDPIPASTGLRYYKGNYYREDGKLYKCIRDDNAGAGTMLYHLPSELVGNYFEEVIES